MSDQGDNVNIRAKKMIATTGGTIGVNRSVGTSDMMSPVGFLKAALAHLPFLWWAVGVGAIIAIVAIVSRWHVPAIAMVFGSLGLFIAMFGLLIFAALVRPADKAVKPPVISIVVLWCFGLLLAGSGVLLASSLFFDRPVQLRSLIVPPTRPPAITR